MKLTKKSAYAALALSIALEQLGTGCLEASETFTRLVPTIVVILAYVASYFCLSKVLQLIDLSISYATWTAVGTIGSALMGIFLFHQTISPVGWGAIAVMIVGVFLLNLYGSPKETAAEKEEGDAEC